MQPSGDDSMPRQDIDSRDPTTYLAEDRTFPAWIRTGIALMGFGFVVARFVLFLRELEATQSGSAVETTAFSVVLGTALIVSAAGLAMAVYIGTQKAATHFPSAAGMAVRAIEPGNDTR